MTTTTPWSDTPPSPDKPGWYHTKEIADGEERPMWMSPNGNWDDAAYSYHTGERLVQFGPRVLSAEETVKLTAEVERLRAENRILNERYGVLEQENESLRRNGVVIYAGSEELQQLRAAAAELAEIKRAWGTPKSEI